MNVTSPKPLLWEDIRYVSFSIQLIQSVLIVCNNFFLLLTILYHKTLRKKKQYVVIFSVALADWAYGCVQMAMSLLTLHGLATGEAAEPISRQACLMDGVTLSVVLTYTVQALMLLVQSLDRLVAVTRPFYYFGMSVSCQWRCCALVFVLSILQTFGLFWLSSDPSDRTEFARAACVPQTALNPAVFNFWNSTHMSIATLSIVVFVVVLYFYQKHMNEVVPDSENEKSKHIRAQRKATLSMIISCSATFFLFVLPRIVNLLVLSFTRGKSAVQLLRLAAILLYNCNPILNFYIYFWRHESIRRGVKLMLNREQLNDTFVNKSKLITVVKMDQNPQRIDAKERIQFKRQQLSLHNDTAF